MPAIFISYRREDSIAYSGRLYDRLTAEFGKGQVFMDIDSIDPGADFIAAIEQTVAGCDAVLVVIGRQWLTVADAQGRRRIENPEDFVRLEVESALSRNVRVVPVLVGGAQMPRSDELPATLEALSRRQALDLPDSGFHQTLERLIHSLRRNEATATGPAERERRAVEAEANERFERERPAREAIQTSSNATPARVPPLRVSRWVTAALAGAALAVGGAVVYLRTYSRPAATPSSRTGQTKVNPKDGLTYVVIPPGTFTMGCSPGDTECSDSEKQPHAVQISNSFRLGQTEVTQAAWKKVNGADNPSYLKGDQLPVETVSWNQAAAYCQAIDGRLPTEKEWEYAARAGTTGPRYGAPDAIAWYSANSGKTTHPIGLKQANAFGLYDMLGNVWEWTADNYDAEHSSVRGGAWNSSTRSVRASYRLTFVPTYRDYNIGFRCVALSG